MPAQRSYISYVSSNGKRDQGFTFKALVMISLLIAKQSEKKLTAVEVASDIANGKNETKAAIYASVHLALRNLEEIGIVRRYSDKSYGPTAQGERVYKQYLDDAVNASWATLSDSKHLARG